MSVATSAHEAENQMAAPGVDRLVLDLAIPPRPQIVAEIGDELRREDPDLKRIARVVASDVALTAAVLRIANSPAYGSSRKIETLGQALAMLGLKQIGVMVTGIVLRKLLRTDGPQLTRFWDVSAKRAWAMAALARSLRGVEVDVAQTFGLFCDVGIPLLMQRFPEYCRTLGAANSEPVRSFTAVEQDAHHADHALIGGLMARSWGVSQTVCLAIRVHHDYEILSDAKAPDAVRRLVAMTLLAERAIQAFAGMNTGTEWAKGGDAAMGALMLGEQDVDDWVERLLDGFSEGAA
ncbi:MAG: HDOD domain-containing protein [Burkholderiales bacterium]|nr:HDOD domain-containing protein [Burkholderiales bacterium]MDE2394541.1 HDOD domain-containing protein [Burkholderiales bacterium]MDE2455393.1 HDOD domain-containing protein [Burkholderiales bacterium]